MRRLLTIDCAGDLLGGTLDDGGAELGVLIVTGGSQTRIGSHRLFERLAHGLAAADYPVLRFDRRGVGDSSGADPGFENMAADITAAVAALRAEAPGVTRVIGLGLCDGATALALSGGVDGVIMINPWLVEAAADAPPPAAIRSHYRAQLTSWTAWKKLLTGKMAYGKALRGVAKIAGPQTASELAARTAAGLRHAGRPAALILATSDATAIAAADEVKGPTFAGLFNVTLRINTDSHTFAKSGDVAALEAAVLEVLLKWSQAPQP